MNVSVLLDLGTTIPLLGLIGVSLSLIGSTTPDLLINQFSYYIFGILLYVFFASVDYRIWIKFAKIFYLTSLVFLLVCFLFPPIRGSHRWIDIGITRLQPSELIKPFLMIILANSITSSSSFKSFLKRCFLFIPLVLIIFRQPDLGNVIVVFIVFLGMEFVGGLSMVYYVIGSFIFGLILPIIWNLMKGYQKARILSFLNPASDPAGTGYNALQAIIAIGSGQLFGMGLGKGTQSHLLFLPEYHTDFVFASIGEELGFIGGTLIIVFYFILLSRILYVSFTTKDNFGKLICAGTFIMLLLQVFINIGMNLGILPITGITLPFVSYGGSSILSSFVALGLVESIALHNSRLSPIVIK